MPNCLPMPVYVIKGKMDPIHCLTYDVDSCTEYIYVGTQSGALHIWDMQTSREIYKLQQSIEACISIHLIGELLITQDKDCGISVWANLSQDSADEIRLPYPKYTTFCKANTEHYNNEPVLLLPSSQSSVTLYSLRCYNKLDTFTRSEVNGKKYGEVMFLKTAFLNSVPYILTAYECGTLSLWDIRNTKSVISELDLIDETPMALDFSSTTWNGICGTDGNLHVFNIGENHTLTKTRDITLTNPGINCIQIRPDNKIFSVGCWDGKVRLYSSKTYKLLAVLECHDGSVSDVIFSKNPVTCWNSPHLLAAGGTDGKVSLWDIYNPSNPIRNPDQ